MFTQATKQNENGKAAADLKQIQQKEQNGLTLSRQQSPFPGSIQRKKSPVNGNWSIGSRSSFPGRMQAKVKIGEPNDKYEKEADAIADKVMSMPAKTHTVAAGDQPGAVSRKPENSLLSKITPLTQRKEEEVQNKEEEEVQEKAQTSIQTKTAAVGSEAPPSTAQRMCSDCSKNEDVQTMLQPMADEAQSQTLQSQINSVSNPNVQAESDSESARGPPDSFESSLNSSKGGGSPLPDETQREMGSGFGADFSNVRVHTDSNAVRMNQQIGAQAFTYGRDIYFNEGKYSPGTDTGKHLLAHELTHTVQQGAVVRPYRVQMHPEATGPIVQRAGPDPLAVDKEEIDKDKGVEKAVQARAPPGLHTAPLMVQGGWLGDKLNEYASDIPGWTLITVVVGYNPLTERDVERTPKNFLKGLMGLVPGGNALYEKLEEHNLITEAFNWLNQQLSDLDLSWRRVAREMEEAWDEMSIRYSFSTNLGIVKDHLYSIYRDVKEFGKRIFNKTIELVKQAILIPLGEYIRDNTRAWPLVTVLLGEDPITGEKVERNLYNIASGFLMLDPDGEAYLNKLNESGKLQELSDWFDAEVEKLNVNADTITQVFSDAWDLITLDNLLEPLDTFKKIFDLFFGPFERIINFVIAVAMKILTAIKDWLIAQLKEHAHKVPGYPLLTVILGKDPVTQEEVPRTAENFIKGFMSFVPGGLEKFENLKKSGAIDKAFTWLEKAVAKLNLSFEAFLQLFIDLWESFTINDLLDPIGAFEKIINIFAAPVLRIIDFAIEVGLKVLEFIFTGVMGETGARVVNIIKKSRSTFLKVIKNPVGFFGNLLKALVKGFKQFGSNILQHLLSGLAGWLFGALEGAGLTLPEKWDFKGIVSLVMQVLGLTWDRMRKKLVDRLGERTVARLETAFEFVKILATEGIAGVWQKIMEYMSGLKDKIFEGIRNWVITKIVTIAIEKLATMWNPVGAVIQSIIAIYNTIMFFIERLNQILDLVEAVVNSIANIANGKLEDAANYVEQAMAKTLPVIISFLARLIGLGGISEAIKGVIKKVQDTVDKGIDKVLDWIVKQVKNLIKKGKAAITGMFEWWKTRKGFKAQDGNDHNIYFKGTGKSAKLMVHSEEEHPVENFLNSYTKEKGKDQIPVAKAAYADMIREIEVLDGAYQSGTPAAQQTLIEATKPKVTNAQERLVTALSQMDIDGKAELGKSFIEFGPESGAEKFAIGGPITRIPPDGIVGSPTGGAQILVTEAAERTKRGASRSYVQGHLIGHRYHGPAARNNLVMVPTGVNKKELQQLEDRAGSMMSSGKPFFYGVKAIMHSGTNGDQYFASTLKKIEPTEITTKNADWSETDKRWILKSGAKSWKSLKSGMKVPVVASAAQVDKILATVKSEISAAGDSVPAKRTALRKAVRAFKELQISHASIAANFNAEDILTPEGENWSRLSSLIIRTKVQKKSLFLQKPNPAEQQADSMADRIVTGNISTPLASSITPVFGKVHKKCATCEQEQKSAPNSFESQLNSAKGGGKTLDKNTQTEMESGFGADFSGVRVHTGQNAAQMSQSIGARAFTHGNDIYFNSGQYNPESREGKHLLAHELTHTVQQGAAKPKVQAQRGPPSRGSPSIQKKDDGTKQSIQRRAGPEVSHTAGGPFVQRGLWDSVTGAAGAVWDATAGAVVDAAGKVVNMTKDMFWSLLSKVAPASLVSLVREISSKGIFGFLKEKITSSLSSIFSGLTGNNEALQSLFDTFGSFSENIISIIEALASGDCGPLFAALDKFKGIISGIAGDAWNGIKNFFAPVGDFFSNLWSNFGAPVLDWLKETASDVWTYIKDLGNNIWEWTSPVRSAAGSAWDWLKETIGIGESEGGDSSGGIIGWIKGKAQEVWDSVKQELSPVIEPVLQVANKIKEFLPLTAIMNLKEKVLGWSNKVNQMGQKMSGDDNGMNAEGQASLRGEILPAVMDTVNSLSLSISSAGVWISGIIGDISTKVNSFIGTLTSVPLLAPLRTGINWLKERADAIAAWAREKVIVLFNKIGEGLRYLSSFIEPILKVLQKIADVLGDLLGKFPDLILGPFWWILPECIKNPIKDFFIKTILSQIPFFGQLAAIGDIWTKVKSTALSILTSIFVDGDLFMAIWKFFKAMLSLVGIPPELVTNIIIKASQAFTDILTNPVGFIINILKSIKLGFTNFFSNILRHLAGGVVDWLFGQVADAGIEIPQDFSLKSILKFVFSILGLSVEKIWKLLEEKIGKEKVDKLKKYISFATGAFEWVVTAMTEGISGVWNKLVSQLNNLWTIVIGQVVSWISTKIIAKATQWLLSLLDVSGITPVINSLLAIWNAVESFAQNVTKILQIINSVVNGIAEMAAGNILPAANYLEGSLAKAIPVIISFLAGQFGLNNIGSKMKSIIGAVQDKVEEALRWLINKTVDGIGNIGRYISGLAKKGSGGQDDVGGDEVRSSSELSPDDIKNNERVAGEINNKLKEKPAAPPGNFMEFYENRKALALTLAKDYKSQILPGLEISISFIEPQQDQSDNDVDYTIKISPNDTSVTDAATSEGSNPDLDNLDKTVAKPSTDEEKNQYLDSFVKVVDQLVSASDDTGDVAKERNRIRDHYHFKSVKVTGDGGWALKAAFDGGPERKALAQKQLKMGGVDLDAAGLSEDEKQSLKFKTNVQWTTGNLGGSVVGTKMVADPVGPDHTQGAGPKSGAQDNLMGKLMTTARGDGAANKNYIRGHLLNDNVGGPGEDYNLYPLTGYANGEHERKIESIVKTWVNEERLWVQYTVTVNQNGVKLDGNQDDNFVDCTFVCEASIVGTGNSKIGTTTVHVKSIHNESTEAETVDRESDSDRTNDEFKAGEAEDKLNPQDSKAKGSQNYQIDSDVAGYLEGVSSDVSNLFGLFSSLGTEAYNAWINWKGRDKTKDYNPSTSDKDKINAINRTGKNKLQTEFEKTYTINKAAWDNLESEFGPGQNGIMEAFDQISGLSSGNTNAYQTYIYVQGLGKWGNLKGWDFDTSHYSNIEKLNTAGNIKRSSQKLSDVIWNLINDKSRSDVQTILENGNAYTEAALNVYMTFVAEGQVLTGDKKLTGGLINSWNALEAKAGDITTGN